MIFSGLRVVAVVVKVGERAPRRHAGRSHGVALSLYVGWERCGALVEADRWKAGF